MHCEIDVERPLNTWFDVELEEYEVEVVEQPKSGGDIPIPSSVELKHKYCERHRPL
jgi:hypothetical protein